MSKTAWVVIGTAAALYLLKMKQDKQAATAAAAAAAPVDLSGISGPFDGWQNDRPADATVSPTTQRGDGTNPLGSWLETTFGIRLPVIAPAYLAPASAPPVQNAPQTPAGSYTEDNIGLPAVPGTWPEATSSPQLPAGFDMGDPNQLASVMVLGDSAIYVNDPVLF